MSDTPAKEHRTVNRVTTILEVVAANPAGIRLHEMARHLDAPKPSVFGLAKGLVASGYLVEEEGCYRLGPALDTLVTPSRPNLAELTRPVLNTLRDQFKETVMLGSRIGSSLVYQATAESEELIRYSAPLKRRRPLYPPSAGKILLANWSEHRRDAYLSTLFTDAEELARAQRDLDGVRESGRSFNRGETLPDVSATARPLVIGGRVVAAIAVAGPTSRIAEKLDAISEALVGATDAAQRRIS
jgi:DNA-binding IclR family transcriptional regulator